MHRARFPEDPNILTRLGSYYFMHGYVNKALDLTQEARRHEGRFNTYYRQKGQLLVAVNLTFLYLAEGNLAAAKTEGLRAVAADPRDPIALRALGSAQLGLHEYEGASRTFEKLTAAQPGNADAWDGLRAALLRLGDTEGARHAEQRLNEENEKSSQESPPLRIPDQYKVYIVFACTVLALVGVVLAVRTIWTAVRPLVVRPETSDST